MTGPSENNNNAIVYCVIVSRVKYRSISVKLWHHHKWLSYKSKSETIKGNNELFSLWQIQHNTRNTEIKLNGIQPSFFCFSFSRLSVFQLWLVNMSLVKTTLSEHQDSQRATDSPFLPLYAFSFFFTSGRPGVLYVLGVLRAELLDFLFLDNFCCTIYYGTRINLYSVEKVDLFIIIYLVI